jgi:hypothetical protein
MDYGAIIWHRPKAECSTASSVQAKKFTTVQWLAMKATTGCYRTTPTAAMELKSMTQQVWLRLQTKVLSSVARMQSLAHGHPIKKWLAKAKKAAALNKRIKHISNLENIAVQFPALIKDVQEISPFKQPLWDPDLQEQRHGPDKDLAQPLEATKESVRLEIKKLAEEQWQKQWEAGSKPGNLITPHLRRIVKNSLTQGQEIYKSTKRRNACATLAQLRTGYCGLKGYLSRFKKADSPECPHCGYEKETVEHFLLECPHYWAQRVDLRHRVGARKMTLAGLLGDKRAVDATLEYVEATGRLKEDGGIVVGAPRSQGGEIRTQ